MRFKILWTAICVFTLTISAYGAEGHYLHHEAILFVEPGDSYIKLFGTDWLRVFRANSNMAFYDKHGKLTCSPEKLVVGTKLVIPAGTYITERTTIRLSRYENIKNAALKAIQRADSFIDQASMNRSGVYQQAVDLLDRAKKVAKGLTFGFENYIEAGKLAEEAIRCFKIDTDLRRANQNMEQLEDLAERERIASKRQIGMLDQQRTAFLGLAIALFVSLLWFVRHKKKKERVIRIEGWLDQHLNRVETLEKAEI
jgi:hypothetical protein